MSTDIWPVHYVHDDFMFNNTVVIGYEPADPTVHPPPQNDRG